MVNSQYVLHRGGKHLEWVGWLDDACGERGDDTSTSGKIDIQNHKKIKKLLTNSQKCGIMKYNQEGENKTL